jgi:hypothetical protein
MSITAVLLPFVISLLNLPRNVSEAQTYEVGALLPPLKLKLLSTVIDFEKMHT